MKQYLVEQDTRDIPLKDLSGMSMQQADALMQQWAYEDLRRRRYSALRCDDAAPTGGVQRIFIHMDHRLIDSCGLVVMINDLMQLYTHYRFGAAYPQDLADFETVLEKGLKESKQREAVCKRQKILGRSA